MFCSIPAYCQHCQLWCQWYNVLHYYIMTVVAVNSQWLFECCTSTCRFSSTGISTSFHFFLLNIVISKKQNKYLWTVITSNSKQVKVKWVYLHQISRLLSSFVVSHFCFSSTPVQGPAKPDKAWYFGNRGQLRSARKEINRTVSRGLFTLTLSINTSECTVPPLTNNPQAIDNSTKLLLSQYFTNLL